MQMKKIGILTFSLAVGILCGGPCPVMSQIVSSQPIVQGMAIHPNEVNHGDFHARHPEAQAITKVKVGTAKGTATKQCYKKLGPNDFVHEGPVVPSKNCNAAYSDCQGSCLAM